MLEGRKITANHSSELKIPIGLLNDLTSARSVLDIMQCYSQWSGSILCADRCTIALNPMDSPYLELIAIEGNQAIPVGGKMPINGSFIGQVFATQRGEIRPNIANDPEIDCQKLSQAGISALMNAPIEVAGRCFGVLATGFQTLPRTAESDFELLKALARCIATQLLIIEQMENLTRIAHTDSLTKLSNRHSFRENLTACWQAWRAEKTPFSVVSIDVDHFKSVNDTLGHDAGDVVLQAISKRISDGTALHVENAIVARLGGEEFCVLLSGAMARLAQDVAQSIKSEISDHPITYSDTHLSLTASIGVAYSDEGDAERDDIMLRADKALYEAKANGRNQIVYK